MPIDHCFIESKGCITFRLINLQRVTDIVEVFKNNNSEETWLLAFFEDGRSQVLADGRENIDAVISYLREKITYWPGPPELLHPQRKS